MTYKKKRIYTIVGAVFIIFVIVLLYPKGKELLQEIRFKNNNFAPESGSEVIYSYINTGDEKNADNILNNKYTISRFDPVTLDKITWSEDPYKDIYWRFNFYNLEPARDLLFAYLKTNKVEYKNKLLELVESFIDNGENGSYSWDYHGTAFRTMTLVDIREKLLARKELPDQLDKKILATLKIHGDFLADPSHFEKDYNHGLDQAAALYLLSVNYPDMEGASNWRKLSEGRIVEMQKDIIDKDGVLVENSPYYHIYVLEKFLEIQKYLKKNNLQIEGFSNDKIEKMISYVVYMLQPNLTVPTIGASITRQINYFGIYRELAQSHPELMYVLTQGAEGQKPSKLNINYPDSGETIMRSGWGSGKNYLNQTQLIFDVGNYRTNHSDLDALSFNLFGGGVSLMPDAGLYNYETEPYRSYFHGTKSHNTVVVDGKDQDMGNGYATQSETVTAGSFKQGDGYVYQSGEHSLYKGVTHERAVAMIENSTILVFDKLKSDSEHTYEQMFHLFPGAKISSEGLTLKAEGNKPEQSLTIKQFVTNSIELHTAINEKNPPDGLCSFEYNVLTPCYSVSYKQIGKNVSYVTAISIGQNSNEISLDKDNNILTVKTKTGEYSIKLNETNNIERTIEANKNFDISQIYSSIKPIESLNSLNEWEPTSAAQSENGVTQLNAGNWVYNKATGERTFVPTTESWAFNPDGTKSLIPNMTNNSGIGLNGESLSINDKENSLEITTPSDSSFFEAEKKINLDLSDKNIYFKIKIDKTLDLNGLDIYLSNNNWEKDSRFNIKGSNYDIDRNNEWIQFGVGKGELRKIKLGDWVKSDQSFDWSKVDAIKFVATSQKGKNVTIDINDFTLVPDQKEPRAIIVFDDGWSSVMNAVKIMNDYEIKGNVAVISTAVGKKNYLTLDNLKTLQNDYGWNIASHSSLHKNAVQTYVEKNDLLGFDIDINDALQYLINNNINSAPNWYIYPDGSTNGSIKEIIGRYYKFARATVSMPQVFPFAEPLEVGVFPVYSDRTNVLDVHNAVSDAIKYNQTLFLMFHKLSIGTPTVFTEYSEKNFSTIIKDIKKQGIKVVTLSELDKENNIPETEFILHTAVPAQINLDISVKHIPTKIQNVIMNVWKEIKNIFRK